MECILFAGGSGSGRGFADPVGVSRRGVTIPGEYSILPALRTELSRGAAAIVAGMPSLFAPPAVSVPVVCCCVYESHRCFFLLSFLLSALLLSPAVDFLEVGSAAT